MTSLARQPCEPCRKGTPALGVEDRERLNREVPEWRCIERDGIMRLERTFAFPDFAQALAFTLRVGELAEAQGHHPAITTEWGKATVSWWTHTSKGLHVNDFILAARTDEALRSHS